MTNIDPSFFMIAPEQQALLYNTTSPQNQSQIESSYSAYLQAGGTPGQTGQVVAQNTVDYTAYQAYVNVTPSPIQTEINDKSPVTEDDPDDPDEDLLQALAKTTEQLELEINGGVNNKDLNLTQGFGSLFNFDTGNLFGDLFAGDLFGNLFGGDLFGDLFGNLFGEDLFGGLFNGLFQTQTPSSIGTNYQNTNAVTNYARDVLYGRE